MTEVTSNGKSEEAPNTLMPCSLLNSVGESAVADSNSVARGTTSEFFERTHPSGPIAAKARWMLWLVFDLWAVGHRAIDRHPYANGNIC